MPTKSDKREIRVYCPTHKNDFSVLLSNRIVCEQGNHSLAEQFPWDNFWEYCCDCRRFIPSEIARREKANDSCVVCGRAIIRRYICDNCQIISVESVELINPKAQVISAKEAPLPLCPVCFLHPKFKVNLHHCDIISISFFTARADCPFCHSLISESDLDEEKPEEIFNSCSNCGALIQASSSLCSACDGTLIVSNEPLQVSEPLRDQPSPPIQMPELPAIEEKPAQLEVSIKSIRFDLPSNEKNMLQEVKCRNAGAGIIDLRINSSVPWLIIKPKRLAVAQIEKSFTVAINEAKLPSRSNLSGEVIIHTLNERVKIGVTLSRRPTNVELSINKPALARRWISIIIAILASVSILFWVLRPHSTVPFNVTITADKTIIHKGESAVLQAQVEQPEGLLNYGWRTTNGTLEGDGSEIRLITDTLDVVSERAEIDISVIVTNSEGRLGTANQKIFVLPEDVTESIATGMNQSSSNNLNAAITNARRKIKNKETNNTNSLQATEPLKYSSILSFVSNVDGVTIWVDGILQGTVSANAVKVIRVSPGDHSIVAMKEGYENWKISAYVVPKANGRVAIHMVSLSLPK
jgi:hypothetical protein